MQHSSSVPWRALRTALGLGAAALVSLALASVASANVITVTPDGSSGTTDNLGTAIASANTNSSPSNTIVLTPGIYTPADKGNGASDIEPITISKNLTIAGPHAFQTAKGRTPQQEILGSQANNVGSGPLFQVNPGVTLRIEGVNIDNAGSQGFESILDNGTLILDGVSFEGPPSSALMVSSGASATLNEVSINSALGDSIMLGNGSLTINNSTIAAGGGNGIDVPATGGYTLNLNNTVLAFQVGAECSGPSTNGGPGSTDDDGSCNVQYPDDTNLDSYNWNTDGNGGPDHTMEIPSPSDLTGKGVNCPTTDGRFFANPVASGVTHCDIGAVTDSATQETAGPTCKVTGGSAGPPATQQVSLQDTATGVGPQAGPATDNPSNTVATAYPPPAAVPVPGYSASNLQIDNGTVATPAPLPNPLTAPWVLTATKTTPGQLTHWSFTGLNWAGVATNCF